MKITNVWIGVLILLMLSACSNKKTPSLKVEGVNTNSVFEAVKQPAYSVNLIRKEIPDNLKKLTQVYKSPDDCGALLKELELLNLALGEDLIDKPSSKKDVFTLDLGQMLSKEFESNLPFNSIVKRLSGARKHEKAMLSAKVRGKSRRSYLQGWSDAMQCQPSVYEAAEKKDEPVNEPQANNQQHTIINSNERGNNE